MRPADHAAEVARAALLWLVRREDETAALLNAAGLEPADLRRRAGDPELLGFVLDFLLADEARLLAFCAEEGLAPEAPMRARAALPGGGAPHWT